MKKRRFPLKLFEFHIAGFEVREQLFYAEFYCP